MCFAVDPGRKARSNRDLRLKRRDASTRTVDAMAPAPSLEEIQYRLEQLCERRCMATFTADEDAEYSRLSRIERHLLETRRHCRA